MISINVNGGGFKPYDVHIGQGLLSKAHELISPFLTHNRVVIVTDAHVAPLWGTRLQAHFIAKGLSCPLIILPAGEQTKSWDGLMDLTDRLLGLELDRKDVVIALGGGVIGDLTGLGCALYMRGIDFIQIPTTLLSQVDSSVGGKTAIDHVRGKNLIGAFWQPRLVLCDTEVLQTLPLRELKAGFAEVIKYGYLGDRDFFLWLETHGAAVLALEPEALSHAIAQSVAMKAKIVAADERESGQRALLNLGHTFGHALEAECGFGDTLLHGEAVSIGMALAFDYSSLLGHCPLEESQRATEALKMLDMPHTLTAIRPEPFEAKTLVAHMAHDKKAENGQIHLILPTHIGQAKTIKSIAPEHLKAFLISRGAQG